MDMLLSVYLIAEFQYPVGIRIPFHVQEVALAVLEAGQPLDLSLGCRLDLLVGFQPVGLDGPGEFSSSLRITSSLREPLS